MYKFAPLYRDIEWRKDTTQKVGSSFWRGKTDHHPCKNVSFLSGRGPGRKSYEENPEWLWEYAKKTREESCDFSLFITRNCSWNLICAPLSKEDGSEFNLGVLIISFYCYSIQYLYYYSLYGKACFCHLWLHLLELRRTSLRRPFLTLTI